MTMAGRHGSVRRRHVAGHQELPSDPDALRALVAVLQAQLAERDWAIAARDAEIHAKTLHIEKLKA